MTDDDCREEKDITFIHIMILNSKWAYSLALEFGYQMSWKQKWRKYTFFN